MNDITLIGDEDPRVDTRLMAEHLGVQHQNVFESVKDYSGDFERLGVLRFETGKPQKGGRGGRPERFAKLNEDQCYLLLTYTRNTDRVRELKVNLVQAFAEARKNRDVTRSEYLPAYHELHDTIHRLSAGSPNERFVHMNVNKAVNKAIGIESGQRGGLPVPKKSLVTVAQMVAAEAMKGASDHHDGYQEAKKALDRLHTAIAPKELA